MAEKFYSQDLVFDWQDGDLPVFHADAWESEEIPGTLADLPELPDRILLCGFDSENPEPAVLLEELGYRPEEALLVDCAIWRDEIPDISESGYDTIFEVLGEDRIHRDAGITKTPPFTYGPDDLSDWKDQAYLGDIDRYLESLDPEEFREAWVAAYAGDEIPVASTLWIRQ